MSVRTAAGARLTADVPVELDRSAARDAARRELSKPAYQGAEPSPAERLVRWLWGRLQDVLDGAAGVSPGGYASLVVLALLVVAAVVAVRLRLGPFAPAAARGPALFTGPDRSAAEHRAAADRHAAAGEWADAVRERLRAVVRSLEERSLLDPRPGRTADEAAAEAGQALPDCADDLRAAARSFDEIWYGGRPATREAEADLRRLDDRLRASRPVLR